MAEYLNPPAFTLEPLDSTKPHFNYKIKASLGKKGEKLLQWKLKVVAQRELNNAGLPVSEFTVENWLGQFGKGCPDIEIIILSTFIEAPSGAPSIEDLYWGDKLEDAFVERVCANFTQSSVMTILIELQMKNTELEAELEMLNVKIESLQPKSKVISPNTESEAEQSKDTSETEKPLQELIEVESVSENTSPAIS